MPLFWLALAFAGGILTATLVALPWFVWALLLVAFTAIPLLLRRITLPFLLSRLVNWFTCKMGDSMLAPIALLAVFLLGGFRQVISQPHFKPDDLAYYNGTGFSRLVGIVDFPPPNRLGSPLRVAAREIELYSQGQTLPVRGKLLVQVNGSQRWQYGDLIQVEGQIETPPENADFSYRDYLARQGVFSWAPYARVTRISSNQGSPIPTALYQFRQNALNTILSLFPAPESALLAGILIGDDSSLPETLYQDFKTTGTAHVIAISGFNLAILVGLFAAFFSRLFGKRWGALAALLAVILYTLMIGPEASVIRAAVMAALSLVAAQLGRRQIGLNTLGLAALVMAVFNPTWLWDVGFQLSFSATMGLILFAEPLQSASQRLAAWAFRGRIPQRALDLFAEYLLFTLAAQVIAWPVQAYHFRHISPLSLLANLIILPAQPAVMVLGGLAALAGMAWLPLGQGLALAAWPFVAFTIRAIETLAQIPWMNLATGPIGLAVVILYYMALGLLIHLRQSLLPHWKQALGTVALLGVGGVSLVIWQTAFAQSNSTLRITFLGGDALETALIQAPGGATLLVNGGSSAPLLLQTLNARQGFFARRLDALLLTRGSIKALGSLPEALETLKPGLAFQVVKDLGDSAATKNALNALAKKGLILKSLESGASLNLGSGIHLRSVGKAGSDSTTLLLEWNTFRAIIPNQDLELLPPEVSHPSLLVVDKSVLKEHSLEEWQQALEPQTLLVSASSDLIPPWALDLNRYRWVQVSTDGEKMWIEGD